MNLIVFPSRVSNIIVMYLKITYPIINRPLSSRLFLHSYLPTYQQKSEILFSASVLQKNVICRVGFLYWKENPLSIRTPSTWDSKPEILHFSRLQFHACFQITLDALKTLLTPSPLIFADILKQSWLSKAPNWPK